MAAFAQSENKYFEQYQLLNRQKSAFEASLSPRESLPCYCCGDSMYKKEQGFAQVKGEFDSVIWKCYQCDSVMNRIFLPFVQSSAGRCDGCGKRGGNLVYTHDSRSPDGPGVGINNCRNCFDAYYFRRIHDSMLEESLAEKLATRAKWWDPSPAPALFVTVTEITELCRRFEKAAESPFFDLILDTFNHSSPPMIPSFAAFEETETPIANSPPTPRIPSAALIQETETPIVNSSTPMIPSTALIEEIEPPIVNSSPPVISSVANSSSTNSEWGQVECKVCMDAEITHIFIPCGHRACCEDCGTTLKTCPMCRAPITQFLRMF